MLHIHGFVFVVSERKPTQYDIHRVLNRKSPQSVVGTENLKSHPTYHEVESNPYNKMNSTTYVSHMSRKKLRTMTSQSQLLKLSKTKEGICEKNHQRKFGGKTVCEGNIETYFVLHPGNIKADVHQNKERLVICNYLGNLINECKHEEFERKYTDIRAKYKNDQDISFCLLYLHSSYDLLKADHKKASKHINDALQIVPHTSNPNSSTLELLNSKTRGYIIAKEFKKLSKTLEDAKMMIETDKQGYTGSAAGWVYTNDARFRIAQMATLNTRHPNYFDEFQKLHNLAKHSFHRALQNFQQDDSEDKEYGTAYTIYRLVILMMRCGDDGLTMSIHHPPGEDVEQAGKYLRHLQNAKIAFRKCLHVHCFLAVCDYFFRRDYIVQALENAQEAYNIAKELDMVEFIEHAQNRLRFLQRKASLVKSNEIHSYTT